MDGLSLPRISVIVPTVTGREECFEKCASAYSRLAVGAYELEFIKELDHPAVGPGWQAGWEKSTGDYIHLSCDDIVPREGWHLPAVQTCDEGCLPAPQVYGIGGEPQSHPRPGVVGEDWTQVHMAALPFAGRAVMQRHIAPLFTAHYFTDDFFSWRASQAGIKTFLRTGYAFDHSWNQHRRGAGMTEHQRMHNDQRLFDKARAMVSSGQWRAPWPPNGGLPQ